MNKDQLQQLAREYAKHECQATRDDEQREIDEMIEYDFALPAFQWLSDRYCIVEKSKLKRMYLDIQTSKIHADEMNGNNRYWSLKGKQDLIDDLFREELFSNTEQ